MIKYKNTMSILWTFLAFTLPMSHKGLPENYEVAATISWDSMPNS